MKLPKAAIAIAKINKSGALLVYPIKDKPHLPSLWSAFWPKDKMNWDWSDEGDNRVAALWHLRTELAETREVVYSKWIAGRATLFSLELFTALLSLVSIRSISELKLSAEAQSILQVLNDDSPLPSKELKRMVELETRANSARFERAMKELWRRFLIVGCGEADEGGYPSLSVGSTKLIFEAEWDRSKEFTRQMRYRTMEKYFRPESPFLQRYFKLQNLLEPDTN